MLFNTGRYAIFFAVVFVAHWALPQRARRPFLLVASYYFYASAIPQYIFLILGLTAFNYGMGRAVYRAVGRVRTAALWLAIAGDLGSLAYFKYAQLLVSTAQRLLRPFPVLGPLVSDPLVLHILLPLGISFFVFEFIHYVVEVYKGRDPISNPVDFALFCAFFPTQIAGPIKRFPDFMKQLQHPLALREIDFDHAAWLVLRGLVKKVVVADTLSPVVAQLFAHPDQLGPVAAWFAVLAFATQIYCDFSGYTDIGRGCATLLGYSVPENFNAPYQSESPAEFWHRWHMSLSTWLRDYLYFPLGGSRVAPWRVYINLMITMALGGLWHGAAWHFVVWGVYQGALLCAHRLWENTVGSTALHRRLVSLPPVDFLRRPLTLGLVCVGWVFFRADSVGGALAMLHRLVGVRHPAYLMRGWTLTRTATPVLLMVAAAMVVMAGWLWAVTRPLWLRLWPRARGTAQSAWWWGASALLARPALYAAALMLLVVWPPHAVQRFIYFQF